MVELRLSLCEQGVAELVLVNSTIDDPFQHSAVIECRLMGQSSSRLALPCFLWTEHTRAPFHCRRDANVVVVWGRFGQGMASLRAQFFSTVA